MTAAADAARWARAKLHSDMFSDYRDLGVDRGGHGGFGGVSRRRGDR